MRDYLLRVLELTRPYRGRLVLGLLCGFLSGALAPTLGLTLKIAVDAVFTGRGAQQKQSATQAESGTVGAARADARGELGQAGTAPASPGGAQESATGKMAASRLPAPLKRALDNLANWFNPPGERSIGRVILAISLIPAAMLLRSVLAYLNVYLLAWVGIRAAADLRVRLFNHLMNLPLGFFNKTSTGDLVARFEGAMGVNSTIKDSFGVIIREPISILVLVASLIAMQPLLSLFTLVVFPICLVPVTIFGGKFRKSHKGVHGKFANLHKVMHESFTGIRVIKAYNLESLCNRRVSPGHFRGGKLLHAVNSRG